MLGLPKFTLLVDHQQLVSIMDRQTLDMVDNHNLQRLKERLSPFVFTTIWRKGKDNFIPDALSRAPVGQPSEEDDAVNAEITSHARHCIVLCIQLVSDEEVPETAPYLRNPLFDNLRSIAATDTAYEPSAWIFQLTTDWMDRLYNVWIVVPQAA
jgi:hypothetical protein